MASNFTTTITAKRLAINYINGHSSTLSAGDVVVFNSSDPTQVKVTTTENDENVVGVIIGEDRDTDELVFVVSQGVATVKVVGAVAVGDYLTTSTTAARAKSNTAGHILGRAITSNASGNGTVEAIITAGVTGSTVTDHGALTNLTNDDHSQYALLVGRSGGTTLIGGTGAGDDLTLQTTSNGTKGSYILSELTTEGLLTNSTGGVITSTIGTDGQVPQVSGTSISWTDIADIISLTFSTGLTNTSNTITNNLSTGVSGGQSIIGGTASGDDLTLQSTSHATKGNINFGANSTYDQVNDRLSIGNTSPQAELDIGDVDLSPNPFAASTGISIATSGVALLSLQGATQSSIAMSDASAGSNLKIIQLLTNDGITLFKSLNDADYSTNAGDILTLDHSTGYVGIGSSTSSAPLHVTNSSTMTMPASLDAETISIFSRNPTTATNCNISIISGTAGNSIVNFGDSDDENRAYIDYDNNTDEMIIGTSAAANLYINSVKLGVGITPAQVIHGYQSSAGSTRLRLQNSEGYFDMYADGGGGGFVINSGSTVATFDSSGNFAVDTNTLYVDASNNRIGIATSSPLYGLDVRGHILMGKTNRQLGFNVYFETTWKHVAASGYGAVILASSSGGLSFYTASSSGTAGGTATLNNPLTLTSTGILNFTATMGNSTKNPETDTEADWIEVQISGSTYYIPVYAA